MSADLATAGSPLLNEAVVYTYSRFEGSGEEPMPELRHEPDSPPARFLFNLARHKGPGGAAARVGPDGARRAGAARLRPGRPVLGVLYLSQEVSAEGNRDMARLTRALVDRALAAGGARAGSVTIPR